jgi:hypothetical protein
MKNQILEMKIPEIEVPEGKQILEGVCWLEVDPQFPLTEELDESGELKKAKLRGKFGQVDIPTANKRVYPRAVIAREFERMKNAVHEGMMYGELDHPGDGKTRMQRVSHLITGLQLEADGRMDGVLEFIPGTKNGDQALAIAKHGGKLGISSRGFGTTVPDGNGNDVVQEDYQLVTFDIVADPANAGAHPNFVMEDKERGPMKDLEQLKKECPELVEALQVETRNNVEVEARDHAREALRSEFEDKLKTEAEGLKEQAVEQAKNELLEDPAVAGAKLAMERIKDVVTPFVMSEDENEVLAEMKQKLADAESRVAKADETIKELRQENKELADVSKELGFHLHLERDLRDNERGEQIVEMLGDVKEYESLEVLKERVEEISQALSKDDSVREEYQRKVDGLEAKVAKLKEERDQALAIGKKFGITAYIEQKAAAHPHSAKLREHLKKGAPVSKANVDRLTEDYNKNHPVSNEYNLIREGMKKKKVESVPTVVENKKGGGDILGVPIEDLINL